MATTTTQMGLTVPQNGDASTSYVAGLADGLQRLDVHDHSTGKGTPVTPAGININTQLPLNGQRLTSVRSTQYQDQSALLNTLGDAGSTFTYLGNLYYTSAAGTPVQLTSGASNIGLNAGFGGDYVSAGALATYDSPSGKYNLYKPDTTLAGINVSSVSSTGALTATTIGATGLVTAGAGLSVTGNLSTTGTASTGALTAPSANISGAVGSATAAVTASTAAVTTVTATTIAGSPASTLGATTATDIQTPNNTQTIRAGRLKAERFLLPGPTGYADNSVIDKCFFVHPLSGMVDANAVVTTTLINNVPAASLLSKTGGTAATYRLAIPCPANADFGTTCTFVTGTMQLLYSTNGSAATTMSMSSGRATFSMSTQSGFATSATYQASVVTASFGMAAPALTATSANQISSAIFTGTPSSCQAGTSSTDYGDVFYINCVNSSATVPLLILGAACRFTATDVRNLIPAVAG